MPGMFNNLAEYNLYRDNMTGAYPTMARHGLSVAPDKKQQNGHQRSWELVKEFKGKSHKEGGIDIEVGDGYVKTLRGKNIEPEEVAKKGRIWKDIGATAYGVGEGLLDTVTLGATDALTDAGYKALQKAGGSTADEIREQNSLRGYGTTAGAVGGAVLTGGATTGSAISQGAKGIGAGVGKGSPNSKFAQAVGTYLPLAGSVAGMAVGDAGYASAALKSLGNADKMARLTKFANIADKAGKVSKYSPFIQAGVSALQTTMGEQMPNIGAGQQAVREITPYATSIMQSYFNNPARQRLSGTNIKDEKLGISGAGQQGMTSQLNSMQPQYSPQEIMSSSVGGQSPSQYQFLNDLRSYGINV